MAKRNKAFTLALLGVVAMTGCAVRPASDPSASPDTDDARPADPGRARDDAPSVGPTSSAPTSCPADVPLARRIATAADAADVQIVNGRVYYRSGLALEQVNLDGTGARQTVARSTMRDYFVDATTILSVEGSGASWSATNTLIQADGTLTEDSVNLGGGSGGGGAGVGSGSGGASGAGAPEVPAGYRIFGSDAHGYYLTDDSLPLFGFPRTPGTQLLRWTLTRGVDPKDRLQTQYLTRETAPMTDPIARDGSVFYVASGKDVMRLDVPKPADPVAEPRILASVDGCHLAIGATKGFCATATTLVSFDLATGAAQPVLTVASSKVPSPLGLAVADGETVVVASEKPADDARKVVLREVGTATSPATERLLACGRESITGLAADAKHVVFVEAGQGVFVVDR